MSATAILNPAAPLRKRFKILEKAQSFASAANTNGHLERPNLKLLPLEMKHSPYTAVGEGDGLENEQEHPVSSPTEYESQTESEEGDDGVNGKEGEFEDGEEQATEEEIEVEEEATRPALNSLKVDTENLRSHGSYHREHTPMSPKSRAWYEFDLAVVVALVSPIGNLLTGGDHIKNLLLLVLLIFYLHQIIEVPWSLYQKARPRNRAFHMPPVDPLTPEGRYAQIASSELQKWELFFLALTFLSPLFGAALLRYATASVLGAEAVSWFSTGLFVLATGVRPWAHLADRLTKRTEELHEFVHYPSPTKIASEEQHKMLESRVEQLEKALGKHKIKTANNSEDLLDYLNESLDQVERTLRKQEKKLEKYDGKFKTVEQSVTQLRLSGPARRSYVLGLPSIDLQVVKTYVYNVLDHVIPDWVIGMSATHPRTVSPKTHHQNLKMRQFGNSHSNHPPHSPSALNHSVTSPSTTLETIVEEDLENEREREKYPALARPYSLTSEIVHGAGSLATMPLRAVARMILRTY